MKRIGLVGEDPNDTQAIQYLLEQNFTDKAQFVIILRNKRGYQLENTSFYNAFKIELLNNNYDLIIFIRDLDGLESEEEKLKHRLNWFKKLNAASGDRGLFLLNIFELEALILADIETFNSIYKTKISKIGNVMFTTQPKELLMSKTFRLRKVYSESHCPELFKKLNYTTVVKNCRYFKEFVLLLEKRLKRKR